jgi:hypothetical protein
MIGKILKSIKTAMHAEYLFIKSHKKQKPDAL